MAHLRNNRGRKKGIEEVLRDPAAEFGKEHGTGGILRRLYMTIMADLGMSAMEWVSWLTSYLKDPVNQIPQDKATQSSTRGNALKEVVRTSYTWKVFCKMLRIIGVYRCHLNITLYHQSGRRTRHGLTFSLAPVPRQLRDKQEELPKPVLGTDNVAFTKRTNAIAGSVEHSLTLSKADIQLIRDKLVERFGIDDNHKE